MRSLVLICKLSRSGDSLIRNAVNAKGGMTMSSSRLVQELSRVSPVFVMCRSHGEECCAVPAHGDASCASIVEGCASDFCVLSRAYAAVMRASCETPWKAKREAAHFASRVQAQATPWHVQSRRDESSFSNRPADSLPPGFWDRFGGGREERGHGAAVDRKHRKPKSDDGNRKRREGRKR